MTTVIVILFCILAVIISAAWRIVDRIEKIYGIIHSLFPWLEMIKRETGDTASSMTQFGIHSASIESSILGIIDENKSSNTLLEGIYNILKKNRDDKKWSEAIQRDIDNKRDEEIRKRIEVLKNIKPNETINEEMGGLKNMIQDEEPKYDLPKELPFSEMPIFNIDPLIKQHFKNEIVDFKAKKTMIDFAQSRLPHTKNNFSFKAMQSLGDAGKFMIVRVPPTGEGLPIKIELFVQNGTIKEYGEHGMQVTDVLRWARNMYSALNAEFPCEENIETIHHIELALDWQRKRTERREKQGTEGYNKEIVNEHIQAEPIVNENWKELEGLPDSNPNLDNCTGCGDCKDFSNHNPGI